MLDIHSDVGATITLSNREITGPGPVHYFQCVFFVLFAIFPTFRVSGGDPKSSPVGEPPVGLIKTRFDHVLVQEQLCVEMRLPSCNIMGYRLVPT